MPPESRLTLTQQDDITIVGFTDPVALDAYHVGEISKELYQLVDKMGLRKIVIDLATVKILSSQTLGVFLNLRQKLTPLNGKIVLSGIDPKLYRVFKVTQLDGAFEFFPDTPAALAAFRLP
jgi:anti-sigma B factor antagonist